MVILLVTIKKRRLPSLMKTVYLFLIGPTLYGGIASIYLGVTGSFIFKDQLEDYRIWITLAGIVLLWVGWHTIGKELSDAE